MDQSLYYLKKNVKIIQPDLISFDRALNSIISHFKWESIIQFMNNDRFQHFLIPPTQQRKPPSHQVFSSMISIKQCQNIGINKPSLLPSTSQNMYQKQLRSVVAVKSWKSIRPESDKTYRVEKPFFNFPNSRKPTRQPFQNLVRYKSKQQAAYMPLKDTSYEIPKLRETNSTICHSPKSKSQYVSLKANYFKKIKLLDKGQFGTVFLVRHVLTGFVAALKVIRKIDLLTQNEQDNKKIITQLVSQIKLQAYMDHPNLIKLYDFFSDQNSVYLLLELGCDGNLYTLLNRNGKFNEETTSILVREITEGIRYMHSKSVIHRDIKLENIVIIHGMAKICDYGWSVHCPDDFRSTFCGSPIYLSPEILKGKLYNDKIDIWAIGALTHELVTKQNPFFIQRKSELSKIVTDDFEMKTGSPQLKSFISFVLRKNPSKRPDSETLLQHPFIKKYIDLQTSEQLCKLIYKDI